MKYRKVVASLLVALISSLISCRQGIYCNNLANCVTEIFQVDMSSMMVGRQIKPWTHSRKIVVFM